MLLEPGVLLWSSPFPSAPLKSNHNVNVCISCGTSAQHFTAPKTFQILPFICAPPPPTRTPTRTPTLGPATPTPVALPTATPPPVATPTPPLTPVVSPTPTTTAEFGIELLTGATIPQEGRLGTGSYELTGPRLLSQGESRSLRLEVRLDQLMASVTPVEIRTHPLPRIVEQNVQSVRLERMVIYERMIARLDGPNFRYDERDFVTKSVTNGGADWIWAIAPLDSAQGEQSIIVHIMTEDHTPLRTLDMFIRIQSQGQNPLSRLAEVVLSPEVWAPLITAALAGIGGMLWARWRGRAR